MMHSGTIMRYRLTETSIPALNLYYDSTKFRPAHGNVDSSTKLVLRFNEIPAGSWKNVDSSTKLVLRFNEIPAGSRKRRFQY